MSLYRKQQPTSTCTLSESLNGFAYETQRAGTSFSSSPVLHHFTTHLISTTHQRTETQLYRLRRAKPPGQQTVERWESYMQAAAQRWRLYRFGSRGTVVPGGESWPSRRPPSFLRPFVMPCSCSGDVQVDRYNAGKNREHVCVKKISGSETNTCMAMR
jgi:hypothetical protein